MLIHGYSFQGDPDGLEYIVTQAEAVEQLVGMVKQNGQAAFLYKETHFIVMPTPSGSYIVTRAHHGSRGFLGSHLRGLP